MPKHVLLVEDEPHIIEALSFLLERDGWSVDTHNDGGTALDRINHLDPDLVILDVMLPNRSGFDIVADMRQAERLIDIPVLMLTAKGQAKDREAAVGAGVNLFMTKPFSNQDILSNARALVGL